ncbi:MAG: formylglycine-generating enzyme family protein [Candidatus Nitrohelix vancouverensis]|uniref:Formylglycine-generating enzyme family protein n=1 Tax=Candidatus Nitrohelix vancouverensis TaxID=2705534 RepID=A0A7T0G2G6_9BACT|nr:MAG: formylglycine-generating enzyme family protein [Candidatus Nitrohelix vancouverensis]
MNLKLCIRLTGLLPILLTALAACSPPPSGMVLVPAGEFIMGTNETDALNRAMALGLDKPWFADESPQRKVNLPSFYIDKYEVTNEQYYIFCQATGHRPPPHWKRSQKYPEGTGRLPVTAVNFFDAAAYAEWAGKRLPNEAEWEKAARGYDGWIYPWGNEFSLDSANISPSATSKSGQGLKPVGSYPHASSPFGAEDMVGNAWEWVWDYYFPYPGNTYKSKDYNKKYIVVRGLSYMGIGHFSKKDYQEALRLKARASFREKLNPMSRKKDLGFRCVKDKLSLYEQWFGKEPPAVKEAQEL